jgi:hyperosmotically inducible protein
MKRLLTGFACAAIILSVVAPAAWAQDRSAGDRVDDAMITSTVKTKLTADRPKSAVKVDVDTKDGVVTLTGTVSTEEQKAEAERLARNTKGVKDVISTGLKVEGAGTSPSASPRK